MSLIKTLAAAGLGYWLGEREGERGAIERRPRFYTVAGRRVCRDPIRLALIVGGAMLALVGLLRLGLAGRVVAVALCLLFWARFHV